MIVQCYFAIICWILNCDMQNNDVIQSTFLKWDQLTVGQCWSDVKMPSMLLRVNDAAIPLTNRFCPLVCFYCLVVWNENVVFNFVCLKKTTASRWRIRMPYVNSCTWLRAVKLVPVLCCPDRTSLGWVLMSLWDPVRHFPIYINSC